MTTLTNTIKSYYEARTAYEDAKMVATELEASFRAEEQKVINAMLAEGQRSITFEDGTRPTLCKNVTISCTKDNFEAIRQWLVESKGDDRDYVEETVNKWEVLAMLKKELESGADEADFPKFLKLSTRPGIRVMGWNGRDDE